MTTRLSAMLPVFALLVLLALAPVAATAAPLLPSVPAHAGVAAAPLPEGEVDVVALDAEQYYVLWRELRAGDRVEQTLHVEGLAGGLQVYLTGPADEVVLTPQVIGVEATLSFTALTAGRYSLWLDDRGRTEPQGLRWVTVTTNVR